MEWIVIRGMKEWDLLCGERNFDVSFNSTKYYVEIKNKIYEAYFLSRSASLSANFEEFNFQEQFAGQGHGAQRFWKWKAKKSLR